MEKYTAPEMELIVLEAEDVILESGGIGILPGDNETPIIP